MEIICLQIDLARQKERIDFVKRYMDFAADNGYNSVLLYLENAVRTASTLYFDKEETYSSEEMKEMVSYGIKKGIDVIPAFENLGHLEKFFAYKEWETLSECEDTAKEGRGFEHFKRGSCGCISKPELYDKLDCYIREVCELFPGKYVHMGLDEPFDFAVCDRCKEKIAAGKTKADLFYEHIIHTHSLVSSLGKTMLMWDDFFEYADVVDRLPRDIIFCNWNYYFISDEPAGHWTGRIKRDWFRYYEELGFKYMFCTYAHRASSLYNLQSFMRYASKHKPFGSITTAWERGDSFYLGAMPYSACAGQFLSGKISSEEEISDLYKSFVGKDCAELLTSFNVATYFHGYNDFTLCCESEYYLKYCYKRQLGFMLRRVKEYLKHAKGLKKDILTDIWDYLFGAYLELELQSVGTMLYDGYETGNIEKEKLLDRLDEIQAAYDIIELNGKALWEKYRNGIKSGRNKFEKSFTAKRALIEKLKKEVKESGNRGVLYADLMLHDGFSTVRAEITARYEDGEETQIYKGAIKPSMAGLESGGVYAFRYPLKPKAVEKIIFGVYGEGSLYPTNFRYILNGKQYVAAKVNVKNGQVKDQDKMLKNDTSFATFGYEDGIRHFNDLSLSKKVSAVELYFKPLTEI